MRIIRAPGSIKPRWWVRPWLIFSCYFVAELVQIIAVAPSAAWVEARDLVKQWDFSKRESP